MGFSTLDDDALAQITAKSSLAVYNAGQLIFSKDDPATDIFVVVTGEIAIEVFGANGKVLRVTTLSAGAVIGEIAVLDQGVRTADARATTLAQLAIVKGSHFRALVREHAGFANSILQDVIAKLRQSNQHTEGLSLRSLKSRLAEFLLIQSGTSNIVALTHQEMGVRLSASREKINGHLQTFRKAGGVEIMRAKTLICDRAYLEDIAQSD